MNRQSHYFEQMKLLIVHIMKTLIKQTKSLIEVNEVADWVHNDRESSIRRMKSPTRRMKSLIECKEKSPLGCKLKLSLRQKLSYFLSFFFLLICFVYAFFVIAQGMSNVLMKDVCGGIIPLLYRHTHWKRH